MESLNSEIKEVVSNCFQKQLSTEIISPNNYSKQHNIPTVTTARTNYSQKNRARNLDNLLIITREAHSDSNFEPFQFI